MQGTGLRPTLNRLEDGERASFLASTAHACVRRIPDAVTSRRCIRGAAFFSQQQVQQVQQVQQAVWVPEVHLVPAEEVRNLLHLYAA